MRRRAAAFATGVLSLLLALAVDAGGGAPAAIVNGAPIPKQRLEAGVNAYLGGRGPGFQFMTQPEQYKEVRRQVLDLLIDRELLWQKARETERTASDADVTREIARIREGFPSPMAFETELMTGGFTEATYAEHLRRELSVQRLIREEIAAGVTVTQEEIDAFRREHLETIRPEEAIARLHSEKVGKAVAEFVERLRSAAEVRIMEPR